MPLTPGTRLGVYDITAPLGEGGMGQVWRATDTSLGRQVAIKILPDAFAADPERLARFEREAKTLASLNHPHIAAIYAVEKSTGTLALVMELVEGDDLSQRIARGAIPLDEALPIAKQIAEALEAAHEQGIIHRDLKPANIKVRADGTVKVLDFGLAKALDPAAASSPEAMNSPTITSPAMTQAGMILGTAAYMSPEQARGKAVDRRADIWAFGCVVYEMLTGTRAFRAEDVSLTLAEVMKSEPDWNRLPAVPPVVESFLKQCFRKDPRQRTQAIGDVRLALDGAFETVAPQATASASAVRPLWRRVLPVAAAVVLTAAIVAGAAWSLRPAPAPSAPLAQFQIQAPKGLVLDAGRQNIALSPDGTRMLLSAGDRLFVRSIGEVEATPLPGFPEGWIDVPVFSPDGKSVAFWDNSDRTLKRVAVVDGQAMTIAQGMSQAPQGMTWGPDGLVVADTAGVLRISSDGGTSERLVQVNSNEEAHSPQLLPGGEVVLFTLVAKTVQPDRFDTAQVVAQSLALGERRTLIRGGSDARYLPTGHIVYAVAGTVYGVAFDLATLTVRGEAVPVVRGVRRQLGTTSAGTQFSLSSNGSLLYMPGPLIPERQNAIRVPTLMDRDGTRTPLALPPNAYARPRVSPDGARLAVGIDEGGDADVWVYDLSGVSAIRRLTFGGRSRFPVWSPDGRRVAFQSTRDGRPAVYVQPANGGGTAERLTDPAEGVSHVPDAWSPDGRTLLIAEQKGDTYTVMALSVADKRTIPVAAVESLDPPEALFSPDGRWVAYTINKAGGGVLSPDRGVFVQPFPPTGATYQVPKTRFDFHPTWGPSGREMFYVSAVLDDDLVAVGVQFAGSPTFGAPTPLEGVPEPGITSNNYRGYDVLPDGRFITLLPESGPAGGRPELRLILNWFDELKRLVPTN